MAQCSNGPDHSDADVVGAELRDTLDAIEELVGTITDEEIRQRLREALYRAGYRPSDADDVDK